MFKLHCPVQNYDWGKIGFDSLVAKIFAANGGTVNNDKHYAEYWMGTHLNGPSYIRTNENGGLSLSEFLRNKHKLSKGLPFLFKVLSINEPLSIQVHPEKKFAEELHLTDSFHYKDDNHKPELAIVLSEEFELLLGIVQDEEAFKISIILYESLNKESKSESFNKDTDLKSPIEKFKCCLLSSDYRSILHSLILLNDREVKLVIDSLLNYIDHMDLISVPKLSLAQKLFEQFQYDKGVIFSLFMNYHKLKKGEYVFIYPNVPHAYLKGDCMECMANSDNVIRLGLTPKFVDTDNFLKILENKLNSIKADSLSLIGNENSNKEVIYSNMNFKEFYVIKVMLTKGENYVYEARNCSVMFILQGELETVIKTSDEVEEDKFFTINEYDTFLIEKSSMVYSKSGSTSCEIYIASYIGEF